MKIISWNVNGLRAVFKKDFLNWFKKENADIVCLQEVKAQEGQIPGSLVDPEGYFSYFSFALKKGYSGVAVYTKEKPLTVEKKIGLKRFDEEGRVLRLEYEDFILFDLYMPNGGQQKENLAYKLEAYDFLLEYLGKIRGKSVILTGDFNIAHEEIDLAQPEENKNNIMFTPEERKQIDRLIESGFVDIFRKLHQGETGQYTWWTYFAQARSRNLGWRIDYVFVSEKMTKTVKNVFILPGVMGSDHCPVGIEI